MKSIAFTNGTIVLPDRQLDDGMVRCDDSRIVCVGRRESLPSDVEIIDAKGGVIAPGYIDLHVHGGAGADFMDGTPTQLPHYLRAFKFYMEGDAGRVRCRDATR